MSDKKINRDAHRSDAPKPDCWPSSAKEWPQIVERAGGKSAPVEVQEANLYFHMAFECKDHYVAVEKEGEKYFYVARWRSDGQRTGQKKFPFNPQYRPIWIGENFFVPSNEEEKNILVIPVTDYREYLNYWALVDLYLLSDLPKLIGGKLVKDHWLVPENDAEDERGIFYRLNIDVDDAPYEPVTFPPYPMRVAEAAPPPPPEPPLPPPSPPEPDTPWPWDQWLVGGGGGANVYLDAVAGDDRFQKNFRSGAEAQLGVRFVNPTVTWSVMAHASGDRKIQGFGFSASARHPDRPLLRSGMGAMVDTKGMIHFTASHQAHWPSLFDEDFFWVAPYFGFEHLLGSNRLLFVIGGHEAVPANTPSLLKPRSEAWDVNRMSAIIADEAALTLSAATLAFDAGGAPDFLREQLSFGIGYFAGQLAYLDSVLWKATRAGKISFIPPTTAVGAKGLMAGLSLLLNEIPAFSGGEYFFHAMLLDAGLGAAQLFSGLDPADGKWILGNSLAGGALLVAYGRKYNAGEEASHLALAGTTLLSYGISLWFRNKGWDRF